MDGFVPSNSSAPISGPIPVPAYPGFPWRTCASKSSVIPVILTAPLSASVLVAAAICKKFIQDPVVLAKVVFSVTELASLVDTLVL